MTAAALAALGGGPIDDILEELADKNHVRVVHYRAVKNRGRWTRREVFDEIADTVAQAPALVMHDELRVMAGRKPIYLAEALRRFGGKLRDVAPNLRTTVGIDYAANALGSSTQPSQADYIALSNNTVAAAVGDTAATLPWSTAQSTDAAASGTTGEWTGGTLGMARKQATYAHTGGATNYTLAATWTAGATVTATSKAGLFGGSTKNTQGSSATTNILFLENTFTSTTLATNDQLSLTWTVNI